MLLQSVSSRNEPPFSSYCRVWPFCSTSLVSLLYKYSWKSTHGVPLPFHSGRSKVISVAVREGDVVEQGQVLAVVEAMKMQNVLRAETRGRISKVACKAGDTLRVDAVMMEFDAEAA